MNSDLKILRHFTAWHQALFTCLRSSLSTHSKDRWNPFHLIRGQSFIFLPRFASPFKHSLLVLTWEVQYESFMSAWCLDGAINSGTLRPQRCLHLNLRKTHFNYIYTPTKTGFVFFLNSFINLFLFRINASGGTQNYERVSDRVLK